MKKFLRVYTRMNNCCFLFSLQAGVVIIGVLGITWTGTSLLINLFQPYETKITGFTILQYIVAYLVLILICGGHVCILLAGSWAHPNLILLGFAYNGIVLMVWVMLCMLSYLNSPRLTASICIQGRCPDVLWLFDTYWRDTGAQCNGDSVDGFLSTRDSFTIAPVLGYIAHWPDYIDQPGLGVPCYVNIPDTANYVNYYDSGNSSCPRADWVSWMDDVSHLRKETYDYYYSKQAIIPVTRPRIPIIPYPKRHGRAINEDYSYDNLALNRTFLNKTALFDVHLQQGCQQNDPQFIVVSLAFSLFFSCFFLYGRAIEFNYYSELIMPFTLEQARFRPPKDVTVV